MCLSYVKLSIMVYDLDPQRNIPLGLSSIHPKDNVIFGQN